MVSNAKKIDATTYCGHFGEYQLPTHSHFPRTDCVECSFVKISNDESNNSSRHRKFRIR